jgi:hypothetical protein
VILDQVTSDKPRLLDLAYHQRGEWIDPPAADPWTPPDKPGYKYLRGATARDVTGPVTLATRATEAWRLAITVDAGCGPAELITATGITSNTQDRVPCAIVRRTGADSTVVWALALDGKSARIERLKPAAAREGGLPAVSVRITGADGRTWELVAGSKSPVR